jgi:gas vesicle protein
MASHTGQTLLALLTGAAIGAGIGILYAPDKGVNTRDKISRETKKAKKRLQAQVKETSHTLSEKAQRARLHFEAKLEDTLSSASYKADEILLAMEDKLEALRRQNAKLQKDNTKTHTTTGSNSSAAKVTA